MATLLITLSPPILIVYFFVRSDKFEEPVFLILKSFFAGILLCFPAGSLNYYLIWSSSDPYFFSFLAGIIEETLKFLVLLLYIKPKENFNEPYDAIVYGTSISLGFATLENLEYVYASYLADPLIISIIRAFSAIPMHACCGIIMGFYFGLFVFRGERIQVLKALLIPVSLHAIYNFSTNLGILFIFVLAFMIFMSYSLFFKVKREQQEKNKEIENKIF
tara:strand:+ start:78 stop:734 length:657 start_codon:yes stop_codon:yes gene_type:complete